MALKNVSVFWKIGNNIIKLRLIDIVCDWAMTLCPVQFFKKECYCKRKIDDAVFSWSTLLHKLAQHCNEVEIFQKVYPETVRGSN